MYFGQEEKLGLVGSFLCKAKHICPHSIVAEVRDRSGWNKPPCSLFFANTCIFASKRLNDEIAAHAGPDSWSEMRFAVIRPLRSVLLWLRRKLVRALTTYSFRNRIKSLLHWRG